MGNDFRLWMQILGNATGLKRELQGSRDAVHGFTSHAKREFDGLKGTLRTLEGRLAGIGVSFGVMTQLVGSARLDKGLTQIGQTAGATGKEVQGLRKDLFAMSKDAGQSLDNLKSGYDSLVQSGLNMQESKATLQGINVAMAVTGARAESLAKGLTTAQAAFGFDLAKPGQALLLLDKMTVAGRRGNAELESLSDIFGRIGVNAAAAGMSFDKTLAFVEALSLLEKNPERLATLTDSTLRVFTNARYMKDAQKATGIQFFDAKGQRRDALAVLDDIKAQYSKLKTDQARSSFIEKAFGQADLDTIKGLRSLMQGDALKKMAAFSGEIAQAGGTLKHDLPGAVDNAVDQVGRLKAALKEAADEFARPINAAATKLIKQGLDSKKEGGLELSGKEILAGGGAAVVSALLLKRFGGAAAKKMLGRLGGTAVGVAEGKALEYAAGVTPVFVTNWPGNLGGAGLVDNLFKGAGAAAAGKEVLKQGAKRLPWLARMLPSVAGSTLLGTSLAAAPWIAAAGGGYMVGTALNEGLGISDKLVEMLWNFNEEQKHRHDKERNTINLTVQVDQNGRIISTSDDMNTHINPAFRRGSFLVR